MSLGDFWEVVLPCGSVTKVSPEDLWIADTFPVWTKSRQHVDVYRVLKTEYGVVQEKYKIHRLIAKPPCPLLVDHRNQDPLDNRRKNLRFANSSQNGANSERPKRPGASSIYRGVCKPSRKLKKQFCAFIKMSGRRNKNLGYFVSEIEAAKAYDKAALATWGPFATLNFPEKTKAETGVCLGRIIKKLGVRKSMPSEHWEPKNHLVEG